MDNFTHTLAGLVVADIALGLRARFHAGRSRAPGPEREDAQARGAAPEASRSLRRAAFIISVLANNGPDLDFVYTGITGGKLGYLLHHRGHTHTLLMAPLLALFCFACVSLPRRALGTRLTAREGQFLLALALGGSVLHVLMDFANNYGVHPFWPFDNSWYYGDAIFIVEPWLIIVLAGSAFAATRSRWLRGLLALPVLGLLGLAFVSELGGRALAAVLGLSAAAWFGAAWRTSAPRRRRWTLALVGCFLLVSLLARRQTRGLVTSAVEHSELELTVLSSTPAPGNPLCWWVLAGLQSSREYVVRQALVTPWPRLLNVERCRWPVAGSTAPLTPAAAPAAAGLRWGQEFRAPLAELRELTASSCNARAFLRFARVPYWLLREGEAPVIGDLRYDRSADIDFAEMEIEPGAPCPRFEPPWQPPFSVRPR